MMLLMNFQLIQPAMGLLYVDNDVGNESVIKSPGKNGNFT